jgi:peroxiredoxin
VLINFWATWCKPCEAEMPAMQRLYQRLQPQGFELLAVSVDDGDAEVAAFRDRLGLTFPILRDPGRSVATRYQSLRFPESWLIGPDGVVAARFIGPREWDAPEYERSVRALLAGTPTHRANP